MHSTPSGGSRDSRPNRNRSRGGRGRSRDGRSGGNTDSRRRESPRRNDGPDEFRPSEDTVRGRRREGTRPAPAPTALQKFLKWITFGLVDPTARARPAAKTRGAAAPGRERSPARPGKAGEGEAGGKTRERRAPAFVEPTTPRLYVGNLNFDVSDADLAVLFGAHGSVVLAEVVRQGSSTKSKGFAFVEMGSVEEARAAAAALNDHELQGRKMLVTGAKTEGRAGDGPRAEGRERPERTARSGDRRERGERGERGERRERGGRGRGGREADFDEIDKPTRRVRPLVIETVTSPSLVLSSLNADAGEVDVTDLFAGIGSIVRREDGGISPDGLTRTLRVELASTGEAQTAVELLDGKCFMGHPLRVTGSGAGETDRSDLPEVLPAAPGE